MVDLERTIARDLATNAEYSPFFEAEVRRGRLIRELVAIRRENGLTQSDVGRLMGVSQSVVADIESAKFDFRYTTLDRYATAASRGFARLSIARHPEPL